MTKIIDTHCHLDEITPLDEALERAKREGIIAIIAVGSGYNSNLEILKISEKFPEYVFPALGLHPWELKGEDIGRALNYIRENISVGVALGEVGLDYKIDVDKNLQREVFYKILEIGIISQKPILIHARAAWEDCLSMVKEFKLKKAVFHWFSGPERVLEDIIESNYFISATPAVKYSKRHKEAIKRIPLENLLLESDSPVAYEGIKSEPADTFTSLYWVAQLKGISREEVAERTTKTAIEFFSLDLAKEARVRGLGTTGEQYGEVKGDGTDDRRRSLQPSCEAAACIGAVQVKDRVRRPDPTLG